MATTKKRVNISLSPQMEKIITHIAKRDNVPEATKISELLAISLDMLEDSALSLLGDIRVAEKVKYLSHEEVWG
jgi:hypothetical protein